MAPNFRTGEVAETESMHREALGVTPPKNQHVQRSSKSALYIHIRMVIALDKSSPKNLWVQRA